MPSVPGHTAGSCLACCPLGSPGPFQQSCCFGTAQYWQTGCKSSLSFFSICAHSWLQHVLPIVGEWQDQGCSTRNNKPGAEGDHSMGRSSVLADRVAGAGLVTGAGPVESPRQSKYNKSAQRSMQEVHLRSEDGWVQLQHSLWLDGQTLDVAHEQRVCCGGLL